VFNTAALGSEENDGKRKQIQLSEVVKHLVSKKLYRSAISVVGFIRKVDDLLSGIFPRHSCRDSALLLSEKGCGMQKAHTDYTEKVLDSVSGLDGEMPLGCLVALMDETFLDVWEGSIKENYNNGQHKKLELCRGDVVIFRGDLVHAGSAYPNRSNLRVHFYLDTPNIRRGKFADGSEEVDLVDVSDYE
jgi:hypothetical protein